ncbi:Pro-apoptotic serine protease [Podospora australis]|uniref:Pro-apoptotic serine protease NMA111 n=1 Tax=Podospora australis TaxID=1536484 RepID=A0AAN6WT40_9PEZI|nr:Pro-apoptotic serine protease [Podospora australis]
MRPALFLCRRLRIAGSFPSSSSPIRIQIGRRSSRSATTTTTTLVSRTTELAYYSSSRTTPTPTTRQLSFTTISRKYTAATTTALPKNMNGHLAAARSKRKEPPHPVDDRHPKHHRPNGDLNDTSGGENTPDDSFLEGEYEEFEESALAAALMPTGPDTAEWQETIQRVVRNVVSIRFCQTCSFDTDPALTSEATGFVVDAERGYILTNRHVVGAGPFWGYVVFENHEEVDAYPVYRDPVHDFGILKFDPKAIKYQQVEALELRPDLAKVGIEIKVVGNDAGEKLSILSGVISRLDRNAPEYGEGYCDFNTSYYQASAAASGGSSGSPVVNLDGFAVALQAGGRSDGAATDYFLPLDRPARALKCLQEGKPITRGDIQVQWWLKPFDECRRLGLTPHWEAEVRKSFPQDNNMVVAEIILPEGPAHGKIAEGDILIKINGEMLTQFTRLDEIMDSNVGKPVKFLLNRGGEDVEVEIEVGDLHRITPDRFVSVAGGSFHDLSYQQARLYGVACKGVYVCEAGGSWRFDNSDNGWIIQTVDHKKTPDLDSFIEVLKDIPDKSRIVVTYKHLRDLHTLNTTIIYVDRHWSRSMKLAVRNDETGLWDYKNLADPVPALPPVPRKAAFIQLEHTTNPAVADLVRSFVHVNCTMPVKLDGFPKNRKWGMGVVIDAEKGLVVISRAIVPYDLCDISITIADSIVVEGKVVFLHPLQNYVIVQYDPKLVDAPVLSARLGSEEISQGAQTYFIGYNRIGRIVHAATTVTESFAVTIPANSGAPRYRAVNFDAITVDTSLSGQCGSGVLVAEDGTVRALWLTYLGERSPSTHRDEEYHLGLGTPTLLPVLKQIQEGKVPKLFMLSCEFRAIQMSQARLMGVSEEWIEKVSIANTAHHQLFMVTKRTFERGEQPEGALCEGDILLTLNGKMITKISDLDVMYANESLDAVIVRDCREVSLKVPTVAADDLETTHAINFCGAMFHRPHHAVRQQISKLYSEVYVSARTRGSPASQYNLAPTNFITHVNDVATPDLESFLREVVKIPDNTYFRMRAVTFDSVPWMVTMKKNEHYFPTVEWIKDPSEECGWKRVTYEGSGKVVEGEGADGVATVPADGGDMDVDVDC